MAPTAGDASVARLVDRDGPTRRPRRRGAPPAHTPCRPQPARNAGVRRSVWWGASPDAEGGKIDRFFKLGSLRIGCRVLRVRPRTRAPNRLVGRTGSRTNPWHPTTQIAQLEE